MTFGAGTRPRPMSESMDCHSCRGHERSDSTLAIQNDVYDTITRHNAMHNWRQECTQRECKLPTEPTIPWKLLSTKSWRSLARPKGLQRDRTAFQGLLSYWWGWVRFEVYRATECEGLYHQGNDYDRRRRISYSRSDIATVNCWRSCFSSRLRTSLEYSLSLEVSSQPALCQLSNVDWRRSSFCGSFGKLIQLYLTNLALIFAIWLRDFH